MQEAPLPPNEAERLKALYKYKILDTDPEDVFDDIVKLASYICETPIALISLVDSERQWFKAKLGLGASQTDRNVAFCAHAIRDDGILEVENALEDERFADNPLVTGDPNIRFYAGAPLITNDGFKLGTLCAIDTVPRQLSDKQHEALEALSRQVRSNLDLRLRTERLKELNDEKNRFFSILAHDLRSPVKNVVALCDYVEECHEDMDADNLKATISDMSGMAEKVDKLIHDILSWARFDRGEMKCDLKIHDLKTTIDSVSSLISDLARQKNIDFAFECPEDISVVADSTMLHSIVQNLVANAIKFTKPDGTVSVLCQSGNGWTCIDVKDTGVGISAEAIDQIFSVGSFFTTEGTSGEQGSGLGLSLCKEFAEKMGGSLSIDSESGIGTTVSVRLPASRPEE